MEGRENERIIRKEGKQTKMKALKKEDTEEGNRTEGGR